MDEIETFGQTKAEKVSDAIRALLPPHLAERIAWRVSTSRGKLTSVRIRCILPIAGSGGRGGQDQP